MHPKKGELGSPFFVVQKRPQVYTVAMETRIYAEDISAYLEPGASSSLIELLPSHRRKAVMRYRQEADRARGAAAFLLLKKALMPLGISDIEFELGEHKKPYLKGQKGIYFNLSHSGSFVMCCVSGSECGCDVQEIEKPLDQIARRFFSPDETAYLSELTEDRRLIESYRIWAMKESFIKATGEGMSKDLQTFSVLEERIEDHYIRSYEAAEGYAFACCIKGSPPPDGIITGCFSCPDSPSVDSINHK